MTRRLASLFLAWGALAGLIAPSGLLAQEPAPAPQPPAQPPPAAAPPAAAPPAATQPAPPPPQPAPPAPPPPRAPKTVAVAPVAVTAAAGSVTIKDFSFGPASVTVNVGDTVTWTNAGPTDHTATANDGSFDTGTLSKGRSASHTFSKAGTFAYVCSIHPNMHGTVRVVGSSAGGGASSNNSGSQAGTPSGSSSPGSSSSPSSTAAPSRSSGSLPRTGVDVGGLALVGAGFLALGLFARRRAA